MSEAILSTQAITQDDRREEIWTPAKAVYSVLMGIALLSHIWLMVSGAGIDNTPIYIWIIRLLPVPFAFYLGKLWRDRGFQLLFIYFLLFFFRCLISNQDSIFGSDIAQSLLSAFWLFVSCYSMGFVLKGKLLQQTVLICATIWTIWITIYSCIGIYAVWTNQTIRLPNNARLGYYGSWWPRLNLSYLPTTTASVLCISILIALVVLTQKNNVLVRTCNIIATCVLLLALAITDSRTGYISLSAGLSVLALLLFMNNTKQKAKVSDKKKQALKWIKGIVIVLIVFALSLYLVMNVSSLFNQVKLRGIIQTAYAEEPEQIAVSQRGFEGDDISNGRLELYKEILDHIEHNPEILLVGESKQLPLRNTKITLAHCHSIYLQVLLESGLPGLLLIMGFITRMGIIWARKICNQANQTWVIFLPIITISLLVGDLAECFIWLRTSQCPMISVFFIVSGIICAQAPFRNKTIISKS